MDISKRRIPKRIAGVVINSLKGGVVPRIGLPYITVGRKNEIAALLHDVDIIADGGASFRFIVGKYGSGKSFLLQTIRSYVMDRGFVVVDADLSPERRLQGTKGQGLATYRELIRNMSTKTRPEGGALPLILDRWISAVQSKAAEETGMEPSDAAFPAEVEKRIHRVIRSMNELVHGFDFAKLLSLYYRSYVTDDEEQKAHVLKWFRGEYLTKSEAREELGVSIIISDDEWYDYMKLFAWFLKQAGYQGFMVMIDELVNISKIPNAISRQYNYEKILTMYNDTLQGKAQYLGILMCGTPQAVEDERRGLYSYEALRSRLAEGKFSREGARDMLAPVIRLEPLTAEEMLVLSGKLAEIHAELYGYEMKLSDEDLAMFIRIEYGRIGADEHITPREVIRDFIELLDILYQHPELDVEGLLSSDEFSYAKSELDDNALCAYARSAFAQGESTQSGTAQNAPTSGAPVQSGAPGNGASENNPYAEFEI
ncbi:P-loop protein of unknown function [Lachnospiraceae bacterium NK3A20]|nr:P-loop protein of unknown function [Lachnospiraceae bacterium NK3A20]